MRVQMKKDKRKLPILDWFIGGAIYDITIGFILWIIGQSASIGGTIYLLTLLISKITNESIPYYIWISFAVILMLIGIIVARKKRMKTSYLDYRYPKKQILPKYIIEKTVINYTVERGSHLNFSNEIKIKALSDNFNRFTKKYLWTGLAPVNLPQLADCKGVTQISNAITDLSSSPWKTFDVYINPINKNKVCECTLKWPDTPRCTWGNSSHVSYSTDEPTKEIVFKINLGKRYAGKPIRFRVYQSLGALSPLTGETSDDKFDKDGCYTKSIKAKRFRYYILDWDWIGGTKALTCSQCGKTIVSIDYNFCPYCRTPVKK